MVSHYFVVWVFNNFSTFNVIWWKPQESVPFFIEVIMTVLKRIFIRLASGFQIPNMPQLQFLMCLL